MLNTDQCVDCSGVLTIDYNKGSIFVSFEQENIYEIVFLALGFSVQGQGDYYYDLLRPGVAILFGEDSNIIIYYRINENFIETFRVEKNSNEEDVKPNVSKYLNKINGIEKKHLVYGLVTCALEQDSDGLYEYIKKHGGEVLFDNPNNQVDPSAEVFLVRQSIEGDFIVDETKLYFDERMIDLDKITVGHFDVENENVIYLRRS